MRTRLVSVEHVQAELLGRILDGPLMTKDGLEEAGVRWPRVARERKPRHVAASHVNLNAGEPTLDL